tara:strand:- start:2134 stop:2583 length:450 start_codon:yes stop_codon:yes gene_type:complete
MRLGLVSAIVGIGLLAGCMSNYEEFEAQAPIEQIVNEGPYAIAISGYNTEAEKLIKLYIENSFGKSLSFLDGAKASFDFTFISEPTANQLATWRDGTAFVAIKNKSGQTLWAGEYNYKGGMEMSGFSVRTDIEAAKITINRLYEVYSRN